MTRSKLRAQRTQLANLVTNLRGEIGEVIQSWVLLKSVTFQLRQRVGDGDIDKFTDPTCAPFLAMADRLEDDIVARLAELGERKIGRLTFYFASQKLGAFHSEDESFRTFVRSNRLTAKRNADISHKEIPEAIGDRKYLHIPYRTLIRGLALAIRLMKRIDRFAVGSEAPFFWRKLRAQRYQMISPAHAGYMIAPYIRLSKEERAAILQQEILEGKPVWETMNAVVNGREMTLPVNKKWAAVCFGEHVLFLDRYPLISLQCIRFDDGEGVPRTTDVGTGLPVDDSGER